MRDAPQGSSLLVATARDVRHGQEVALAEPNPASVAAPERALIPEFRRTVGDAR
jgi:hypothetical protein